MKRSALLMMAVLLMALPGCRGIAGGPEQTQPVIEPTAETRPAGPSATPAPAGEEWIYTVMAEEFLSLREAPDPAATCLCELEPGTLVLLRGIQGHFARVEVVETGQTGYVLAEYLQAGVHDAPEEPSPDPVAGRLYAAGVQEFLSLRVAPDTGAERVAKLSPGALLLVLDADEGFARVQDVESGARGYVLSDYLVLSDTGAGAVSIPGEQTGLHAVLCREYVSLRQAAAGDAAVVATLQGGVRVTVSDHDGAFSRVMVKDTGQQGYILSEYLTPVSGDADGEAVRYTVVCEEYLSLREQPDTTSARVAKLTRGTVVEMLGMEGGFARVTVVSTGQTGYVLEAYLIRGEGEPVIGDGQGSYLVRCQEYLTLRSRPSTGSQAVMRLLPGDRVQVSEFTGSFAKVTAENGKTGYVLAGYLAPSRQDPYLSALRVVKPREEYGYEQMMDDLEALADRYPGRLRLQTIGKTLQGRDIPVAILGDIDADCHILIQAGIHGREYMTSLLVMAQLEYCLQFEKAPYADGTVEDFLKGVCIHILPMTNPDGVAISRQAVMTDALEAIYNMDTRRGYTDLPPAEYLQQWKANAAGVDINRNFDAGWADIDSPDGPSLSRYKGQSPGDQPETAALAAYTRRYDFAVTVSYHAHGSCIYWQYGDDDDVNALSRDLGRAVLACTAYPLAGSDGLDAGGYKDWAMDELSIPSLTIEIGTRPAPLPMDEFATIWERNRSVIAAVARWAGQR